MLSAVVAIDLIFTFKFVGDARVDAIAEGVTPGAFGGFVTTTAARAIICGIGLVGVLAFARKSGQILGGSVALGALCVIMTAERALFGSPWRNVFFSGLCLLGWLAGLVFDRVRGAVEDESSARVGSAALLGAAYFNAGLSKLTYGGMAWLSGAEVQSVIIGQGGLVAGGITRSYRQFVVTTPTLLAVLAAATIVFEFSGPLLIARRRVRVWAALGLLAMHTNIGLLSGIFYGESMILLLFFGFAPDASTVAAPSDLVVTARPGARTFTALAGTLALVAMLGVARQARRYGFASAPRAIIASPIDRAIQRFGPFAVGQQLATGWTLAAFASTPDGFAVMASGEQGRTRFDFTCLQKGESGPFDIGPAHIYYPAGVDFDDVKDVGEALRDRAAAASRGRDVCTSFAQWRAAAE